MGLRRMSSAATVIIIINRPPRSSTSTSTASVENLGDILAVYGRNAVNAQQQDEERGHEI